MTTRVYVNLLEGKLESHKNIHGFILLCAWGADSLKLGPELDGTEAFEPEILLQQCRHIFTWTSQNPSVFWQFWKCRINFYGKFLCILFAEFSKQRGHCSEPRHPFPYRATGWPWTTPSRRERAAVHVVIASFRTPCASRWTQQWIFLGIFRVIWTGVGKCPILGILDITKNSSYYRHL